ncbi:MAG: glycerol-3-phosphate dehydrogenase/oxidase, partial [Acidimicrobiales bacterium]
SDAPVVASATGVRADWRAGAGPRIWPAKGVHVTVPAALLPTTVALVLPVPADGRSIFVVPWPGADRVYIGTTDTDYDGPLDAPTCTAEDTFYLLDAVNGALTTTLTAGDVVGSWAGLRPLLAGAGGGQRRADLSRRHRVTRGPDGVVTIAGGKLTTYRAMAADTVDEVVVALGRHRTRSPTAALALRGAGAGAPSDHLTSRFGTEARVVRALIDADGSLAEPLVPSLPYQRAEAVYAARYEMARTLDDVLARRTRARILAGHASSEAAAGVADLLAPELGWDEAEAAAQVRAYRAGVG